MNDVDRATPLETIAALLSGATRDAVPIENAFVRATDPGRPAPLSRFVSHRRERALRQYLLAHAVISSPGEYGPEWSSARDSRVWARALHLDERIPSNRTSVSKGWAWLESQHLIARPKTSRLATVQLLKDDGSGAPYERPTSNNFQLPHRFWLEGWDRELPLAATAALLIALSLPRPFPFRVEEQAPRYGVSASFLAAGLRQLEQKDVLTHTEETVKAPLSPAGIAVVRRYRLADDWKVSDRPRVRDEAA
ncbi:MAG: hypothetical protein J7513_16885 [Solirubrobacteraceae bacterium]|nr:hypothetical protein [Solirubrobacteraceae bacterium]